jgi:hypothetical protein
MESIDMLLNDNLLFEVRLYVDHVGPRLEM